MKKVIFSVLIMFAAILPGFSQVVVLDEIIATVGDQILLRSELDLEFEQMKAQSGGILDSSFRCVLFDDLLSKKLLLYKAQRDSIAIPDERIDAELDKRIQYFVAMFKSEEALEEYYGKSILEIKSQNRERIREQMQVAEMRNQILRDVKASPAEIKKFFNEIPPDSLPFYSAEVEVAQILRLPKVTADEKSFAYERIKELRDRIVNGANFELLAKLYSDDKASGARGGELGFMGRGQLVPEFEAVAFKIKPDTISRIIETQFGYHFIKLIDRRGEQVNVRHILIIPQTVRTDLEIQRLFLDSLRRQILADSITFSDAAKKFSDDEGTKASDGFFTDGMTGSSRIPLEILNKEIYYNIEPMKPGDISDPVFFDNKEDGTKGYRILYLKEETKPHVMNMVDDYQKIQALALQKKQQDELKKWIAKHSRTYDVTISEAFRHCTQAGHWIK